MWDWNLIKIFILFFSDNSFYRQKKFQHKKCSYLDESNIILSPHLVAQPTLCASAANDASDALKSRRKVSQIARVHDKTPNPDINISSAPDSTCILINPIDSMTQTQNNINENSMHVHTVEVNGNLPMVNEVPESSKEETIVWRCAEFVSGNHEGKSPEVLWKKTSGQKLQWCHERLSKAGYIGLSAPSSGLPTADKRAERGYRRILLRASRGERKHETWANHKDVHSSFYSLSALQNQYECLCSSFQLQMRHSPGGDLRDVTDRKHGQKTEFADAYGVRLISQN